MNNTKHTPTPLTLMVRGNTFELHGQPHDNSNGQPHAAASIVVAVIPKNADGGDYLYYPPEIAEAMTNTLAALALAAASSDEFIWAIQDEEEHTLLDSVYEFERSTPTNIERFRFRGWFFVASTFWHEAQGGTW